MKRIKNMTIGESGYCAPWAFDVNDGHFVIDGTKEVLSNCDNGHNLFVTRQKNGYEVDFSLCPQEFFSDSLYDDIFHIHLLPIIEVVGA